MSDSQLLHIACSLQEAVTMCNLDGVHRLLLKGPELKVKRFMKLL